MHSDKLLERVYGIVEENAVLQRRFFEQSAPALMMAVSAIAFAFRSGRKLIVFGNGGSAAQADHIATEFACRFQVERGPLPAMSLTTNGGLLTAIANDYDFEDVFARQVAAIVSPGDVALGISTSGASMNVVYGLRAAQALDARTIGLTGCDGGKVAGASDFLLNVPSGDCARVQEAHALIGHVLCEYVEAAVSSQGGRQ